jgi:hypothetical protein
MRVYFSSPLFTVHAHSPIKMNMKYLRSLKSNINGDITVYRHFENNLKVGKICLLVNLTKNKR